MNDLIAKARWAPRWIAILIVVAWTVAVAILLYEYSIGTEFAVKELLAALPLSLLLAYGSLAFVLNSTEVHASSGLIQVRNGPVPAGLGSRAVHLDEVEFCYYRHQIVPLKSGSATVYAAGIRLRNGKWFDIISSFSTLEEAKAAAELIAAQVSKETGRSIQAGNVKGYRPPIDWRDRRGLLIWSGAFIAALLWILVVDTF